MSALLAAARSQERPSPLPSSSAQWRMQRSGACSRVQRGAEGCSAAGQAIPALDLHALPVNALRAQAAAAALAAGASGA